MKEKLVMFVVSHKDINPSVYLGRKVIRVGNYEKKYVLDNLIYDNDKSKDNISDKNPYYCELTALYWVWKNYHNVEYVGFEHYRRLFYRNFFKIASVDYLYKKALKYDVIHKPNWWHFSSIKNVMIHDHGKKSYSILEDAIKKLFPEYVASFNKVMKSHHCKYCNTIIMRKTLFDKYMEFMFNILFECEKHISEMDKKNQNRSIGYLSERLLDVFIDYNHLTHKSNYLKFTSLYKKSEFLPKKFTI